MAERRHLGSNAPSTATLDGAGSGGPIPKAMSAEQEKHYSHAKINEVTKHEQNQYACHEPFHVQRVKLVSTDPRPVTCSGQLKNFSLLSLIGLAYCIL